MRTPTAPRAPAPPVLQRLRAETRRHHDALEVSLAMVATMDHATYVRALRVLSAFHEEWHAARHDSVVGLAGDDLPTRQWLASDLAALSAAPLREVAGALAPLGPWQSVGAAYVIEGSALGAKTVLTRVRVGGWPEGYFRGLAQAGGGRWPSLMAALREVPESAYDDVVDGAVRAFERMLALAGSVDRSAGT